MPVPKSTNWCVFILSCLVIPLVPLEKCYGSPLVDQHWENETTTTASSASDGWEGDSYESYEEVIDDSYYPDFPDPPPPTSRPSEPQKGEDHTNKKKSTRKRRTTNKNSLRTTERIPLMSLSRLPQRLQMMASDILFSIPNVFRIMNKIVSNTSSSPDMNGLFAIILCTLASVEAILDSSSQELADSGRTTRDIYGEWTVGEEETSESEEESSESTTDSLFRKHYWVTHHWRTPEEEATHDDKRLPTRRQVGSYRYLYRGNNTLNSTRGPRRRSKNRTTRVITGRWPSSRRRGRPHSVRPGFGRPRKNSSTLGLMTPGSHIRRAPRKSYYTFQNRGDKPPYFRWHTSTDANSSNLPKKISRGSRRPYGTRLPPRPKRFKWLSQFRSTKGYYGNLTCRLFVWRNRTTILLFSPRRRGTTPYPDEPSYASGEIRPTILTESYAEDEFTVGTDDLLNSSSTYATEIERPSSDVVNYTISYPTSHVIEDNTTSVFNHILDGDTTFPTLSRQIDSTISINNSTTKVADLAQSTNNISSSSSSSTTSEHTTENEFPDISFKLKYSPEPG